MGSCCNSPINAHASCPRCDQQGAAVESITPQHTLKREFRGDIKPPIHYYFCETPSCSSVYFSENSKQLFTTEQLINRVTCKDPSPDTPLCYCFKITKGDVMSEYQQSGESSVIKQIEEKMAARACFCDKSNPRGICCTTEIRGWLSSQGIEGNGSNSADSCCGSSDC